MLIILLLEDILLWTLELLNRINVEDAIDDSLVVLVIEVIILLIVPLIIELLTSVFNADSYVNNMHDLVKEML